MPSIKNTHKKEHFALFENTSLLDSRLSWAAKGVLSYILSKPEGWETHVNELSKHSCDGKTVIYSALKELRYYGYVSYCAIRDGSGRIIDWTYYVYPNPEYNEQREDPRQITVGKKHAENLDDVLKSFENKASSPHSGFLNVEKLNVGKLNVEKLNTYNKDHHKKDFKKKDDKTTHVFSDPRKKEFGMRTDDAISFMMPDEPESRTILRIRKIFEQKVINHVMTKEDAQAQLLSTLSAALQRPVSIEEVRAA